MLSGVYKHLENNVVINQPFCSALCWADEVTFPFARVKADQCVLAVVRFVAVSHDVLIRELEESFRLNPFTWCLVDVSIILLQ